jgi:phthalate 4,5-dioxygenase
MISAEENNLLTQTGPKTPAGELLRRYWQPVALSEELPEGGAPLTVRIMGEDLVLFRDDQGRPGLLGLHCSHRGTDLSYGRSRERRPSLPLSRLALRCFGLRDRTAGRAWRRR